MIVVAAVTFSCSAHRAGVAPGGLHGNIHIGRKFDHKFDSSLLILIRAYRAGGYAAAETAAQQNFVAWSGHLVAIEVLPAGNISTSTLERLVADEGGTVSTASEKPVHATLDLAALDRLAASDKVRGVFLSAVARLQKLTDRKSGVKA